MLQEIEEKVKVDYFNEKEMEEINSPVELRNKCGQIDSAFTNSELLKGRFDLKLSEG